LYKALLEQSADRAEFLSHLFARPRPAGLNERSTSEALFQAYAPIAPDSAMYKRALASVKERITHHGFTLSTEDWQSIEYVYSAFFTAGPDISYSFPGRGFGPRGMPSYAELMVETDGQGAHRSYLGSEENFRALKELEANNLVVPLVGDFAGPKAIRAV